LQPEIALGAELLVQIGDRCAWLARREPAKPLRRRVEHAAIGAQHETAVIAGGLGQGGDGHLSPSRKRIVYELRTDPNVRLATAAAACCPKQAAFEEGARGRMAQFLRHVAEGAVKNAALAEAALEHHRHGNT